MNVDCWVRLVSRLISGTIFIMLVHVSVHSWWFWKIIKQTRIHAKVEQRVVRCLKTSFFPMSCGRTYRVGGRRKYFPCPALSVLLSEGPSTIHCCFQGKTAFLSLQLRLAFPPKGQCLVQVPDVMLPFVTSVSK